MRISDWSSDVCSSDLRNGTLAAEPRVVRQEGVDSSNGRYSRRVIDLGIAAFKGCSPLKLPQEYYQTSNGGWSNLNYHWPQIGRASCRERVCQYVSISVVAVSLKKKNDKQQVTKT